MRIKKITSQHRRDFTATMQCEFCGKEDINNSGYDDRYYHDNVIPNMKCPHCKESTVSGGADVVHTPTKYPEGFQI